jgi:predicted lipid-binding transport protein (Tim44 family)
MAEQPATAQQDQKDQTQPAGQDKPPVSPEPESSGLLGGIKKRLGKSYGLILGLGALIAVFLCVLLFALTVALLGGGSGRAAHWVSIIRDLFIILLAIEGMFTGIALILLVLQLAALVNLLQNEIKPIVDNANATVQTVRGTAEFMSQNAVEPVVKFGMLVAGIGGVLREVLGIRRSLRQAGQDKSSTESK